MAAAPMPRVARIRATASPILLFGVLAPAVAIASKYVVDWITAPIVRDRDQAEAEVDAANTRNP